jgi:hypothetical protein
MSSWYYLNAETSKKKLPQLWRNKSWFPHHDNVPVHASLWPTGAQSCSLSHPTHLTWLQKTFFLFPKLESTLKGR